MGSLTQTFDVNDKNLADFLTSDQDISPEIDTFQAGGGNVGFPPSTAKLVGQIMSNHKKSLFRSIGLAS